MLKRIVDDTKQTRRFDSLKGGGVKLARKGASNWSLLPRHWSTSGAVGSYGTLPTGYAEHMREMRHFFSLRLRETSEVVEEL